MRIIFATRLFVIFATVVALALTASTVLAHERRDVGKYQFVVGWAVEPAFEGEKNDVFLRVTNRETGQPVTGLESTLQVEVHHGENKTIKSLRAVFGTPGSYQADLIPTAPGDYEFHFKGTVEGLAVEEEFASGPGRFDSVKSSADIQFPERLMEVREVSAAVRGVQSAAGQAQDTAVGARDAASSARTLAIAGIVLGMLGITSGAGAAILASRRQRQA